MKSGANLSNMGGGGSVVAFLSKGEMNSVEKNRDFNFFIPFSLEVVPLYYSSRAPALSLRSLPLFWCSK